MYMCFICSKEGHFIDDCPDKPKPKEVTLAVNMLNTAAIPEVNVVTRSQTKLLTLKDKPKDPKNKGKQVVKDEWVEQRSLAAKLTEEFAEMKPEKPETSQAREITRILPKDSISEKKQGCLLEQAPVKERWVYKPKLESLLKEE